MFTLSLSLRLSAVALLLVAGASSAGSDPSDSWRGWYLWGPGPSPTVVLNFELDASFWVATMQLSNDHQLNIQQNGSSLTRIFHRAASQNEVDAAPKDKIRLFFDARFPKKNPASPRMVSLRRVDECGVKAVYVEPMP